MDASERVVVIAHERRRVDDDSESFFRVFFDWSVFAPRDDCIEATVFSQQRVFVRFGACPNDITMPTCRRSFSLLFYLDCFPP